MKRVSIGVHVHAQPERLQATLESLQVHTPSVSTLALLPDGPDEQTRAALTRLSHLPQWGTDAPMGAPACFNRLVSATDTPVVILLESGSIVGPGWLEHLMHALDADPKCGLVGPSTNRSWNEQGAFSGAEGSPSAIARTAATAARCFEDEPCQTLEPLYSLADFCYGVRREVIEAVGAADEAYGLGSCWEMDYNIRAARAGFRGVWARRAYVYRHPFTPRRRREEARRFAASKQRYQDKFCALRLRGERDDYQRHCQGDVCEHFAPPDLIQMHLPLPVLDVPGAPLEETPGRGEPSVSVRSEAPMVSCIMPTCDRRAFALQSVRYFQRQDYSPRELIIVDQGTDNLSDHLPDDPRIRYLRVPSELSIGAMRNRACQVAQGSVIAQWDDDDWYAPHRLRVQVDPLLDDEADITGLCDTLFFDLERWVFWRCTPELHQRLFVEDVHGGTLVFRKRIWEQLAQYPERSLGEDAVFLRAAKRRGARLIRVPNHSTHFYLRHGGNSWSFACGQYLDPQGWKRVNEPSMSPADRAFYAERSPAAPEDAPVLMPDRDERPLVSCIMPTADRRAFVPRAIHYFLRQDYPHKELIVVDDGDDAVNDLMPDDPRIRYVREKKRRTIGAKRNLACEWANGALIAHWDDDDWSAPRRLRYQVSALLEANAMICGLATPFMYDARARQGWQYVYPTGGKPWVYGATLCYTKTCWRSHPFPEVQIGEDTRFVWQAESTKVLALSDPTFFVGLIHAGNTSSKRTASRRWRAVPARTLQRVLEGDWADFTRAPSQVNSEQKQMDLAS